MKKQSPIFVAFVLLVLMLFKVSSFHVYSHQDDSAEDIENCNICELAIENQNNDFVFTASQIINTTITDIKILEQPSSYDLVVTSSFLRSNFFGRPPPNMG